MSIIARYILKEHVGPFIFALLTIVFVFILNIVFRDLGRLLGKGLTVGVILEFFLYNLAWIIALAVPMAVLISTLMAFGRLSADSEMTAIKASGIHLYRVLLPVVLASVILAAGLERFNNSVLPEFNLRVKLLYRDISRKKPTLTLEPHVFFDEIENLSILVHQVDNRENLLKGIIITDRRDTDKPKTIIAEQGTLQFEKEMELMVLTLINGEVHELTGDLQEYRRMLFNRHIINIAVDNMVLKRSESEYRGDREKSAKMMREDIQKHDKAIAERHEQIDFFIMREMSRIFPEEYIRGDTHREEHSIVFNRLMRQRQGLRRHVQLNLQQIQNEIRVIEGYRRSISALRVEIHKKYSIPIACIVFILVGAPLGIMARQGGLAVGGGMSMLFFLVYWAFLIGGEQLADRRIIDPVVAMWAPNLIIGAVGIYLVIHAVHETTFIHWEYFQEKMKRIRKRSPL